MTKMHKQIEKIVHTFTQLAQVNDENFCTKLTKHLCAMNQNDVVDYLIVVLNDLIEQDCLKITDVLSHLKLITDLSSQYSTPEDLVKRLHWLKAMNLTHKKMPLTENHQLALEAFDKLNQILGTDFDAYHTGGFICYLHTNHVLERYHSDLDLFINEVQLPALFEQLKTNPEFVFSSNLNNKTNNGHEFKINYKNRPISIGLFLFERKPNNEIILKSYYHANNDPHDELLVDEKHLLPRYAKLTFPDTVYWRYQVPYRMQSLESIYLSKQGSRPKDQHDANIIHDHIDMKTIRALQNLQEYNYTVTGKKATNFLTRNFIKQITETQDFDYTKL